MATRHPELRYGIPRLARRLALLALLSLLAGDGLQPLRGAPLRAAEEPAPAAITNEDVVQTVMAGDPVEEILEWIESSPVRFDLHPDVLAELRIAGVPEKVIQAMILRARATAAPPETPAEEREEQGWIEIAFEESPGEPPAASTIVLPEKAKLPDRGEEPEPLELAFIVVCTNPTHVPGFWKGLSPAPDIFRRHRVLFFREETAPLGSEPERKLVYLVHPPAWRFEVAAGIHRGYVGVAARLGDDETYGAAIAAPFEDLTVEKGRITRVHVRLRSTRGGGGSSSEEDDGREPPTPGEGTWGSLSLAPWRLRPSIEITGIDPPEPPPAREGPGAPPPP
jgi:hypothetical protein